MDLELTHPDNTVIITANTTAIDILIRNPNAIRYGKENGLITIDISQTADHATLRVIDDGPGIPEELRKRVERFSASLAIAAPAAD